MENCRNHVTQYNMTTEVVCTLMPNPSCQHLFTQMVEIVVVMTIVDEDMAGVAMDILSVAINVDQ
jgi:hypothetical protein